MFMWRVYEIHMKYIWNIYEIYMYWVLIMQLKWKCMRYGDVWNVCVVRIAEMCVWCDICVMRMWNVFVLSFDNACRVDMYALWVYVWRVQRKCLCDAMFIWCVCELNHKYISYISITHTFPMRILVRLVLNWKFLETISRCCATLSAIGCKWKCMRYGHMRYMCGAYWVEMFIWYVYEMCFDWVLITRVEWALCVYKYTHFVVRIEWKCVCDEYTCMQ